MAISAARRFLLDSMAYGLWAERENESGALQEPEVEVGQTLDVDLTMEDESEDPESLYAAIEKETGVKFEVDVDRDPDGSIFGIMVNYSADTAPVTIRDEEELQYVLAKLKAITNHDD